MKKLTSLLLGVAVMMAGTSSLAQYGSVDPSESMQIAQENNPNRGGEKKLGLTQDTIMGQNCQRENKGSHDQLKRDYQKALKNTGQEADELSEVQRAD